MLTTILYIKTRKTYANMYSYIYIYIYIYSIFLHKYDHYTRGFIHAQWLGESLTRCQVKSSQVKLSFIVIPLHVETYSGTRCRASQDHGAT